MDGKINNVSFKTQPQRIDKWKRALKNHFNSSNINILKSGATFKVSFATEDDEICSVKINFYKSGSMVIQGPKCSVFKDLFFNDLKLKVDNDSSSPELITDPIQSDLTTVISPKEQEPQSTGAPATPHREELNLDHDRDEVTPVIKNQAKIKLTPQEKVNLHSKTLDNKLSTINTALHTMDSAIRSMTEALSKLTLTSVNIPSLVSDSLITVRKKMQELFNDLEAKIKQSNKSHESTHVKLNVLDNQIKGIDGKQEAMAETLLKVTSMVSKLQDKLDDIENKVSDCIYVGEYNESDTGTASKSVLPQPTGKKLVIKLKQKKVRVKR